MLAIDQSFLELIIHPDGRPPKDPATGKPIERLPDRIDELTEAWQEDSEVVIIPTPALSQFLILAHHQASDYLGRITASSFFRIEDFDTRAAIELAAIHIGAMQSGKKRKRGDSNATWAKVNFDRQIVAIAKVNNAAVIYTDDGDMIKFAKRAGIDTVSSWELPAPRAKQTDLFDEEEPRASAATED